MFKRRLFDLATLTSIFGLLFLAANLATAAPPGATNNPFPPSFYGFNPGYYGPYYPGHYQYGSVNPSVYGNSTYPRFSGYGTTSPVPVPYSAQLYGSSSTGTTTSVPPVSTYGYGGQNFAPSAATGPARGSTAVLAEVHLPTPAAELWVEGQKTASTGTWRRFLSPPLSPGDRYVYEFRARWYENGHEVIRKREIRVRAGDRIVVDFTQPTDGEATSAASY